MSDTQDKDIKPSIAETMTKAGFKYTWMDAHLDSVMAGLIEETHPAPEKEEKEAADE